MMLSLTVARGQGPVPSPAPGEKLPYQIRVNHEGAVDMYGTFVVGIYGDFAAQIKKKLESEPAAVSDRLTLFLDGVQMKGLKPVVLPGEAFHPGPQAPAADIALQYTLDRDSTSADNRAAWDTLLPRLAFGEQGVQVGVSLDDGLAHLSEADELRFRVRPAGYIWAVIAGGLVLFALMMFLTVAWTNMLRESGSATPYSLGKSQMAFWGLLVAVAFVGVFTIGHKRERIPPQVLVLLGISSVTGLGSVLINQKAANDAATGAVPPPPDYASDRADFEAKKARYAADKVQLQKALRDSTGEQSSLSNEQAQFARSQSDLTRQVGDLDAQVTTLTAQATKLADPQSAGGGSDDEKKSSLGSIQAQLAAVSAERSAATSKLDAATNNLADRAQRLDASEGQHAQAQKALADLGPAPRLGPGKRGYHFFTDITSDDTGMSFHRLQAALWTVILGVVFVTTVCNTLSMPEFESTLLILMGISNSTYLGFKIPEKTA